MSKKSKERSHTSSKVNRKSKPKKVKKKSKNLSSTVKPTFTKESLKKENIVASLVSKQKKRNKPTHLVQESNVVKKIKNKHAFGAASSESEPEAIDPQWHLGSQSDTLKHNDAWAADSSSESEEAALDPNTADLVQSSDLDESESDIDEELNEAELNSLLLNKTHTEATVSSSGESDKSTEHSAMKLINSEPHSKKTKKSDPNEKNKTCKTETNVTQSNTCTTEHRLSLNDRAELLREIESRSVDLASRSLYVSPVPANCSLDLLKQVSPTVVSCRLSYNSHTKTCRKYAFLEYADSKSANEARKKLMGRLFAGRTVSTQPGRPQYLTSQGSDCISWNQLFITGLHQTVTKSDLQQAFPKAQEVDYPFHARGHPLGYAVVKFCSEEIAFESFNACHKRTIKGQPLFVNYVIQPCRNVNSKKPDSKGSVSLANSSETMPSSAVCINEPVESKPTSDLKRPGPPLDKQRSMVKKPKVLIRSIQESAQDDEDTPNRSDLFEDDADIDDLFIKPVTSKTTNDKKSSHILAQLVKSRKEGKLKLPANECNRVKPVGAHYSDEDEEESNEGDDASSSDASISDSRLSLAGDSSDPDSATLSEEDDEDVDDGSTEEEEDLEHIEVESIEDVDTDSAKGRKQKCLNTSLFDCPPSAEESAALDATDDSSGEEVDNALGAVMHARRSAMRTLKNAGTSKRAWSVTGLKNGMKNQKVKKGFKPFMLPVPSKLAKS